MAWRFVRQPNGLLAQWSDIVDNFVAYDMSPAEAAEEAWIKGMSRDEAWAKVGRGIDDAEPWTNVVVQGGDGLSRWRECLKMIRHVHGKAEAEKVEREMSKAGG